MAEPEKTPLKSPPEPRRRLSAHLVPGNPGNSGGKKGRSCRKPLEFLALCKASATDPTLWAEAREKQPFSVLDMAAGYTHGKPKSTTELTGEVTVRVVRVPRK